RRGTGPISGWLPPRRARLDALSLSIRARNASRNKTVRSSIPDSRVAVTRRAASGPRAARRPWPGETVPMTTAHRPPRVRASDLTGRGWLHTAGTHLSLQGLRGKIVLLDFWTFCCINCLHVIDELRDLEERFADVLVTIGVHSPKFVHEADPDALAAAVQRYEVAHPVLDDPQPQTWKAYTARA